MTAFSANPFAFIFPAIVLCAAIAYFAYNSLDRMGGEVIDTMATVIGKHYTPPSKSHYTNIVDGKSFVQTQDTPEMFALALLINGEPTSGVVTRDRFATLNENDRVQVKVRRTRMTKQLQVLEVK